VTTTSIASRRKTPPALTEHEQWRIGQARALAAAGGRTELAAFLKVEDNRDVYAHATGYMQGQIGNLLGIIDRLTAAP
jgi:hypothetical protein